jgi:hypothetical protein
MTTDISSVQNSTFDRASQPTPRKLSHPQLYALHLTSHYKLKRISLGWWTENHPRWGVTQKMRTVSARAIN